MNVIEFLHNLHAQVRAWSGEGRVIVRLQVMSDTELPGNITLEVLFDNVVQPFTLDANDTADGDNLISEIMGMLRGQV